MTLLVGGPFFATPAIFSTRINTLLDDSEEIRLNRLLFDFRETRERVLLSLFGWSLAVLRLETHWVAEVVGNVLHSGAATLGSSQQHQYQWYRFCVRWKKSKILKYWSGLFVKR